MVKSRRANLRGEYCYNPENKISQEINRIKIAKMGFARAMEMKAPVAQSIVPILGPTIVEKPVEEPPQEKVKMTPELKRMIKEKQKQAEEDYESFINSRMTRKKYNLTNDLHRLACKEREFMNDVQKVEMKENTKPAIVSFEDDEEVDISAYKHLLAKDKENSPENVIKKEEPQVTKEKESTPKIVLNKTMKLSDFIKAKTNK